MVSVHAAISLNRCQYRHKQPCRHEQPEHLAHTTSIITDLPVLPRHHPQMLTEAVGAMEEGSSWVCRPLSCVAAPLREARALRRLLLPPAPLPLPKITLPGVARPEPMAPSASLKSVR